MSSNPVEDLATIYVHDDMMGVLMFVVTVKNLHIELVSELLDSNSLSSAKCMFRHDYICS